ncbi:hypothetical protein COV93_07965 [Candidatus Woesearchaeota archaeon CG11_big_fil_rev_8_21_14_0_20_43_8]|nr:MAG: hypothetical protein COV93_07965 [Candidatus Woesearchaeota archaeon CG11_big_fil_rev_8_21_14_0_20_43_8]PIO05531.1 MAG: hypothetical protein COT47_04475 [Candidatus Woesearchaeota archaeon CG08_land_8_20_14_0_20_43_7]
MNKKAFIYTITAFLLLSGALMSSIAYSNNNLRYFELALASFSADKINFVMDDVTDHIYQDLILFEVKDMTIYPTASFRMNLTGLSQTRNYSSIFNEYEDFIEEYYSLHNNVDVELIGFNNSFTISPFELDVVVDLGSFMISGDGIASVSSVTLVLFLNDTSLNISSMNPSGNGGCAVDVQIKHPTGGTHMGADLDPMIENDPFSIGFASGANVSVSFGKHMEKPMLLVEGFDLSVDILDLRIDLASPVDGIEIVGGNVTIISPMGQFSKEGAIIIAEK